jgi:GNAT superfamily N-acetyltransferase
VNIGPEASRAGRGIVDAPGSLTFRSRYWDDQDAKAAYKRFLLTIHGIDLGPWNERGFWDDAYTPFSLFDGDRVVSSVCLYSMDMVVAGRPCKVGQFSGVGTLPEFRRHGLNRGLTRAALEWASPTHAGYFLFADDDAVPFYRRCGFESAPETIWTTAVERRSPRPGLRKLDPGNDRDVALVFDLACARSPVSDVIGAFNPKLLMFHWLVLLREHAWYVPDLEVALFSRTTGDVTTLIDVVGKEVPPLSDLQPYLPAAARGEVRFGFVPDKMKVDATARPAPPGDNPHVLPPFQWPAAEFRVPHTARA